MQSFFSQLFLTISGVGASLLERLSNIEITPLSEDQEEFHDKMAGRNWRF